jgi:nuclease S1
VKYFSKSSLRIYVSLLLCLLLLSGDALSWGPGGHMIVAKIAYTRLNHRAKAEVDKLIKIDIEPVGITAHSLDFVNASHWPDDLRPDEAFHDTLPLHFADFPFSADGTQLPSDLPAPQNVITALDKYVKILKTSTDDNQRAEALRFIIHFVGDIHQPLHCSTRVTAKFPEGDRGGNLFKVKLLGANGKMQSVKLHSYWDGGISDFPRMGPNFTPPPLSQISPAVKRITKEFPDTDPAWKAGGPEDFAGWAKESTDLAQPVAYDGLSPNGKPGTDYKKKALKTAHQRVAWAGYRLAELLNSIFPEQ